MTCFFLQNPHPMTCPSSPPHPFFHPFFVTLWKRSPPLTWLWGVGGGAHVECRGQAGLGGQVKGGNEEEEEEQYALGKTLAPNKVGFWMPGSQWGESISPLIHLTPPQPWAGPRQRICPHALPKARLFISRAGAEEEALRFFLIATCPSWPTLGGQHPPLEQ